MNQPDLGKKIAELRKAKGFTQEELVEKCNLSVRTLQRIESGDVTPRSYTIKIIFAALDYTFYDSSEILTNRFSKTEFVVSNWLEQFYRYVLDLFNLKTDTMRKITILSIMFFAIIFGLSAIFTESKAQNDNKADSQVSGKNSSTNKTKGEMGFSNFSCQGCFDENDEMIGRDVKFRNNGVTVNVRLIKLNKKTHEFNVGFVKGTIFQNKVEVTLAQDMLNDGLIKCTADKVEKSGDKILLKGNAKLTSSQNETIESDEIIITTN
jgi:transcriptional regulator with XRE-family HTH domain